jgi:predicted TPR repeat methyltransferase
VGQVSRRNACMLLMDAKINCPILNLKGLISRGLAPHAKKIVGVDISEAMVKHSLAWADECKE